jgi:TRAP-type C4-dicarboxylate transport system substrate-binding protein
MQKTSVIFGAALTALALTVIPAAAQNPISVKFSHVVANDTPKGKGALKFKELAEKYTGGKVKVEVYPNSSLFKDKEEIEALQLGSVQMLAPSTAKFAPLGAKEFEALDLPWLFKDDAEYSKVMKGEVGKWLFQKLESKGISGLAYWDNGFHMVTFRASSSASRARRSPISISGSSAPSRRSWRSRKSTRRCKPAWWMAAKTPLRTTRRRNSTRCRSTSPCLITRICNTR